MSEVSAAFIEFTIESASALSNIHALRAKRIMAIEMPPGWDAAAITFLSGSNEDGLHPVHDDAGTEISITVAADRIVAITGSNADALAALNNLQIRSGTTATPVNQTAERTIKLLVK